MKAIATLLFIAAATAGCNMASEEDQMENAIRENLKGRVEVQEVEMTRGEDGNFTGFALVVEEGRQGRLACTGSRNGDMLNYECLPDIDEPTVQQMETQIRDYLAQQNEVIEVDLNRVDHSRMEGFARVRDGGGELRANCTATRESRQSNNFRWECTPAEQAPAAAGNAAPAMGETAPAADGGKPGADQAAAPADGGKD